MAADGERTKIAEFALDRGLSFPNIEAAPGSRFERDGGIPTFVLMGPGHELLMVDEGKPNSQQIQEAIDQFFD